MKFVFDNPHSSRMQPEAPKCDEEWCKGAVSCRFTTDLFTIGEVHVTNVRRWDGLRSSGG